MLTQLVEGKTDYSKKLSRALNSKIRCPRCNSDARKAEAARRCDSGVSQSVDSPVAVMASRPVLPDLLGAMPLEFVLKEILREGFQKLPFLWTQTLGLDLEPQVIDECQ